MDSRRRALCCASIGNEEGAGAIDINNYLTIKALENGLTASLSTNACEYCVDGDGNWKSLAAGTATESINAGQTLLFRGELIPRDSVGIGTFTISKRCNLEGNCMSMLFGDNAADNYSLNGKNYAFYYLFRGCTTIVEVSEGFLPATTLANYCYNAMFAVCRGLTTAPELPATTLADSCYEDMFGSCSSLTTAPELPATTLADSCYYGMFHGCTSMVNAPELPATRMVRECYRTMFYNCRSLVNAPELPARSLDYCCYGRMFDTCTSLTTAPELHATTLAQACYKGMFVGCTSLVKAPELPATTLAHTCYDSMFEGCIKLNYIKMLATNISNYHTLYYWVSGVASTGTFVKNPAMTSLPTGTSGIPSGWTVVNDGEESGNLITFTIDSMPDIIQGEYQAEQGMTWSEWCASEYNVDNFYIGSGSNWVLLTIKGTGIAGDSHYQLCNNEGDDILGTDIISTEIYYEIT